MLLVGLIIIGAALILSCLNVLIMFFNAGSGNETAFGVGFIFHIFLACAYVTGIILFIVGVLQKLGWI